MATPRGAESTPTLSRLPEITDPDVVRRVFGWEDVLCPLPGHGSFAELLQPFGGLHEPPGELVLECDCLGQVASWERSGWQPSHWYGLADAFYAIRSNVVLARGDKLTRGQRFVWRLLLTHEAGLIEPVRVDLRELRADAAPLHRQAREFFALLAGLRLRIGGELTMPFPDRLLAAWFEVQREEARASINALRDADVITQVGRDGPRGPYLFLPGEVRS